MQDILQNFARLLRGSSATTRALIGVAIVLIAAVAGVSGWRARNPHFVLLYSDLDEATSAKVQNALAGAGVRYRVSQPPAPYFVHVDETQEYPAKNAVALSDALRPEPIGIQTATSGVFLAAGERIQAALKREWQEMEKQLEALEFIGSARVTTSVPSGNGLTPSPPPTVSVVLDVRGAIGLRAEQAKTVARLVQHRFRTSPDSVIISDSRGQTLFDGSQETPYGSTDLLVQKSRSDRELSEHVNRLLEQTYGEGLAFVTIASEWSFDQTERVSERIDPTSKGTVKKTTQKTKTPQGASTPVGGAAGIPFEDPSGFGVDSAGVPPSRSSSGGTATTENTETMNRYGVETEHVLSRAPKLERLSVALVVDKSLAEELAGLETTVKAAVGFDESRGDVLSSHSTAFKTLPRDEEGNLVELKPAPAPTAPNAVLELLVERGVEIVAALFFLVVLLRTLKSAKPAAEKRSEHEEGDGSRPGGSAEDADAEEVDPETLAQAKVEELLNSDPERVSRILAEWAAREAVEVNA